MRLPIHSGFVRKFCQHLREAGTSFAYARSGNIALSFALVSIPVIVGVGASFDFTRAYNSKSKMQTDLDSALLSSVKEVGSSSESTIKTKIANWFAGQTRLSSYTLDPNDIDIDTTNHAITAKASASVPTTVLQILGRSSIPISVTSTVTGSATDYINVYIVIDKSASMLLAATSAGQATMVSKANCVFACHSGSNYTIAKANSVTLRSDVAVTALTKVLSLINTANSSRQHVKAALYTLGTDTTGTSLTASSYATSNGIHLIQDLTYSNSTLTEWLTNSAITSASSYNSTDFRALQYLASSVGTAGDGSSESAALKIVMLITDGAQSSMGFITTTGYHPYITPINPSWCSAIKNKGATMAVLYTEYLAVSTGNDVSYYTDTLGKSMSSSYWTSKWSGDSSYLTSSLRRDKIEAMLTACASSKDYFLSASSTSAIEAGFASLLTTYLSAVRLTN